ncbi:MAG: hypothetical protein GY939_08330, partial [Actinomycetia bacterium]|nr:hypothetical protein [Actinomycetes bacterium]
ETDDLVDFLAENGIEIDVETDEFGVRFPIEDDIDEDTMELIDEFYASYEFDLDDEAFFDDLDELGISIEELEDCEQELFEYEEALMMEDGHYFDDDYCDDEDEDDDDDDIESSDDPAENDPTD